MSLKCSEYFASCLFVLQTETDFLLLFKDNNENRLAIKNIEVIPKKPTTAIINQISHFFQLFDETFLVFPS